MADNVVEYGIEVKDNSAEALAAFQRNVEAANKQLDGLSKKLAELSKAQTGAAAASRENAGATEALKKVAAEIERGFTDLFGALQRIEEHTKEAAGATRDLIDAQQRGAKAAKEETAAVDAETEAQKRYAAEVHRVAEEVRKAKESKEKDSAAAKSATGGLDKLATANAKVDRAARIFRATTSLLRGDFVGFTQQLKGISAELAGKLALGATVATLAFQQWSAVLKHLFAEMRAFYELEVAQRMRNIAAATEQANKAMEKRIDVIQRAAAAEKTAIDAAQARAQAEADYDQAANDRAEAKELDQAGDDAAKKNEIRRKRALRRADIQAQATRTTIETEGRKLDADEAGLQRFVEQRTQDVGALKTRERRASADRKTWEMLQNARRADDSGEAAGNFVRYLFGEQHRYNRYKWEGALSRETLRDATVTTRQEAQEWNDSHRVNSDNERELSQKVGDMADKERAAREAREKAEQEIADARQKLLEIQQKRAELGIRSKAADERAAKAREDVEREFRKAEETRLKAEEDRAKQAEAEAKAKKDEEDAKTIRDAGLRVQYHQKHEGKFGPGRDGARKFVETYFGRAFSKGEWEEFRKAPENQAIVKAARTDWLRVESAEAEANKRETEAKERASQKVSEDYAPRHEELERQREEAHERRKFDHNEVVSEMLADRDARKEARAQERKEKRAKDLLEKAKKWEQDAKPIQEGGHGAHLTPFQRKTVEMMQAREAEERRVAQEQQDLKRAEEKAKEEAREAAQQRKDMRDSLKNIDAQLLKALTVG